MKQDKRPSALPSSIPTVSSRLPFGMPRRTLGIIAVAVAAATLAGCVVVAKPVPVARVKVRV